MKAAVMVPHYPCHCGSTDCQRDAENRASGWYDGMAEAARLHAYAVAHSGLIEAAAVTDKLIAGALE